MKEQTIQGKIITYLEKQGFYVINVITASKNGVNDLIACSPTGRFWSIEVKKPGEEPSKLQFYNIDEVEERGGVAFWCDSFQSFLMKYKNSTVV